MVLLFVSVIEFCFLMPEVTAQTFNLTAQLVILIELSTREAKAEIETHPLTAESKVSKFST